MAIKRVDTLREELYERLKPYSNGTGLGKSALQILLKKDLEYLLRVTKNPPKSTKTCGERPEVPKQGLNRTRHKTKAIKYLRQFQVNLPKDSEYTLSYTLLEALMNYFEGVSER